MRVRFTPTALACMLWDCAAGSHEPESPLGVAGKQVLFTVVFAEERIWISEADQIRGAIMGANQGSWSNSYHSGENCVRAAGQEQDPEQEERGAYFSACTLERPLLVLFSHRFLCLPGPSLPSLLSRKLELGRQMCAHTCDKSTVITAGVSQPVDRLAATLKKESLRHLYLTIVAWTWQWHAYY